MPGWSKKKEDENLGTYYNIIMHIIILHLLTLINITSLNYNLINLILNIHKYNF